MKKANCIFVLVLLLASGCSAQSRSVPANTAIAETVIAQITATAQIVALHTSVAGTVVAQIALSATPPAASTATRESVTVPPRTPTPSSTAPPTKMAMPTFGATIVIPDTWQSYKDPDGKFSLRYPEDWVLVNTEDGSLTFQAATFNTVYSLKWF